MQIDEQINETLEYWIEPLGRLCAQPSISAQKLGIDECADLTATMLREEGFSQNSAHRWQSYRIRRSRGEQRADTPVL